MIRSIKCTTKYLNKAKRNNVSLFITEYRRVIGIIINDIFRIIELPRYLNYGRYKSSTWLSARVLRRIADHAIGIVKGIRKSNANKIPDISRINPSLDSKNFNVHKVDGEFNEFISLRCIGNHLKINIPIKYHRQYHKWNLKGRRMGGIELTEKYIKINFEINVGPKIEGRKIGIDQGIKKTITTSDNQKIQLTCQHGHTLESIINTLNRRRKGSKGFRKAQEHRRNFINWSINQLNLNGVKSIGYENIKGYFHKRNRGRLNRWAYSLINKKVVSYAEEHGVRVIWQSSSYRSRRCSSCGCVARASRRGERFRCIYCGFEIDADLNAALNHEAELPAIGSRLPSNEPVFWRQDGLFGGDGRSLQSLPTRK